MKKVKIKTNAHDGVRRSVQYSSNEGTSAVSRQSDSSTDTSAEDGDSQNKPVDISEKVDEGQDNNNEQEDVRATERVITPKRENITKADVDDNSLDATAQVRSLTGEELGLLEDCEQVIQTHLKTSVQVVEALAIIQERRLYRETHSNFAAYCKERWGFSKAKLYRLLKQFRMLGALVSNGDTVLPQNEFHTRLLSGVPTSRLAAVLERAKEKAGGGNFTGKEIKEAIAEELENKVSSKTTASEIERSVAPISLEQVLDWLERAAENVEANQNRDDTITLLQDATMAIGFMIESNTSPQSEK